MLDLALLLLHQSKSLFLLNNFPAFYLLLRFFIAYCICMYLVAACPHFLRPLFVRLIRTLSLSLHVAFVCRLFRPAFTKKRDKITLFSPQVDQTPGVQRWEYLIANRTSCSGVKCTTREWTPECIIRTTRLRILTNLPEALRIRPNNHNNNNSNNNNKGRNHRIRPWAARIAPRLWATATFAWEMPPRTRRRTAPKNSFHAQNAEDPVSDSSIQ